MQLNYQLHLPILYNSLFQKIISQIIAVIMATKIKNAQTAMAICITKKDVPCVLHAVGINVNSQIIA